MSELEEYESQLDLVNQGLLDAPNDESLLELKSELTDLISMMKQAENSDKPSVSSPDVVQETGGDSSKEITKSESPPAIVDKNKGISTSDTSLPPKFEVGQHVMALDPMTKQFKPAKISLVAGSSSDRSYTIKFQNSSVATVKEHQIKDQSKKSVSRKPSSLGSTSVNGAPKVSHLPSKAKLLDDSKNKWQKFNQKFSKKKSSPEILGAIGGGITKSQSKKGFTHSTTVEYPEKSTKRPRSVFNSSTRIG